MRVVALIAVLVLVGGARADELTFKDRWVLRERMVAPVADTKPAMKPEPKQQIAHVVEHVEQNVCTRHHMRKVVIRGGKSWRCRR